MKRVKVVIQGHLERSWMDWVEGLSITYPSEDETLLSGTITDQAALYGLIGKLRDLGVHLISIDVASMGDEL